MITFSNIADLVTYINQYIIPNHNNEITAEQHNNVENGLAQFIISSPRNYNKAFVTATPGAFVAVFSQCVLVFKAGASGSIQLLDNKWNEWVIYNNSGTNKTLVGSISSYISQNGSSRNYVPTGKTLCIAKGSDNVWYEIASTSNSSGGGSTSFAYVQFEVGQPGSPIIEGDTELVITASNPIQDSELVNLDGDWMQPNLTDIISYTPVYTINDITLTFTQGVLNGQRYYIKYATT